MNAIKIECPTCQQHIEVEAPETGSVADDGALARRRGEALEDTAGRLRTASRVVMGIGAVVCFFAGMILAANEQPYLIAVAALASGVFSLFVVLRFFARLAAIQAVLCRLLAK